MCAAQYYSALSLAPARLVDNNAPLPCLASFGVVLSIAAALMAVRPERQGIAWGLAWFSTSLISIGSILYFRAFGDVPRLTILRFAGQLGDVPGAIMGLFQWSDGVVVFPLFLIALLFVSVRSGRAVFHVSKRQALRGTLVGALLTTSALWSVQPGRYDGGVVFSGEVGPLAVVVRDVWRFASEAFGSPEAGETQVRLVQDFFQARRSAEKSPPRAPRPYNVIFLQVESLQTFVLGLSAGDAPITPNLAALASKGTFYSTFFPQTRAGNTSDAEFAALCSLYPATSSPSYREYSSKDLSCLPEILERKGYQTLAFHANRPDFWNRDGMYPAVGIRKFYAEHDFQPGEEIGLGLGDGPFLEQVADILISSEEPYFALVITLSSHSPFNDERIPDLPGPLAPELDYLRDYLRSIHYADRAIGRFIARLEETGALADTILVVYGDHEVPKSLVPIESGPPSTLTGESLASLNMRRVPLIIVGPDIPQGMVDSTPSGQVDIAPTVSALLGVNSCCFVGRNLNDHHAKPFVNLRDLTFVDSSFVLLNRAICLAHDGSPAPPAACRHLSETAEKETVASRILAEFELSSLIGLTALAR